MPTWRILATAVVLTAYALLSHALMTHWPDQPWSVAVLFGPLLAGLTLTGLVRRHALTLIGCALLGVVLVLVVQTGGVSINHLYVLQHAAIHAVLGWTFAVTLRPGATPLITLMAERVHEVFTPEQRAYTSWLTGVWVAYFAAMIVVSLALYALAPWEWWSIFCNLITPLSAAALFVGEHIQRYRRHPEFERVTMARAVRAFNAVTSHK